MPRAWSKRGIEATGGLLSLNPWNLHPVGTDVAGERPEKDPIKHRI